MRRTCLLFAAAVLALTATTTNVDARLSVVGGGEAVVFTGTAVGETQEIRTPVVSGFESFTVSFWHKVVTPRSNKFGTNTGIPGSLWSYWAVSDGPSLGSGWSEKRANGQDVFKSTPVFSAYAYKADRYVKHKGHTLSPGQIPFVEETSTEWIFYLFSYDGERREIVKYQHASDCYRNGVCQGQVENTTESVEDAEYFQGLESGLVPKGMFRFGQSDPTEPTLTMELDDICIFNEAMSLEQAADIQDFGCESVPGLALNYNFNQRRAQSPDLFDTVSGTYNGISRSYVDRGTNAEPACDADATATSVGGDLAACEDAMVPDLFQGKFSEQLMLDFGADIGPVGSNQGSATTSSSTSAKMNVMRAASQDSAYEVGITAQCKGNCRRFTVTSLPSEGVLCWTSRAESLSSTCNDTDIVLLNEVVPLIDGHDTSDMEDHRFRETEPIYYYPLQDSVAGARDSFIMLADDGDSPAAESATLTVQIITNTPSAARDSKVTMADGTTESFYLPGQSEYLNEVDGMREATQAVVVRVEYDHLVDNPPRFLLRACTSYLGCNATSVLTEEGGQMLDVKMPFHDTERDPVLVPTFLRDLYLVHAKGSGTGEGLITIVYVMSDGIEIGPEAKLIVTVTTDNKPPVVASNALKTVIEGGAVSMSLSEQTFDVEGDTPLWRVTKLPENGRVFQVHADGSKGAEILLKSASGDVQQWTDGSMNATATSEWVDWGVDKIDGPPVLYPRAGDLFGVYTPANDWDRSNIILVLFVPEPVFLSEISFFFTWGPGAVVQIETTPFEEAENATLSNENDQDWEVVYSGDNTQTSYCVGKPLQEPCADITRHRLCPKPYKTNQFRVTLSAASLARYLAIDAVLTQGTSTNEANIVVHPDGNLIWEPNKDFDGTEALTFVADDCPAFQILGMDPLDRLATQEGKVSVQVEGINDAPKVELLVPDSGKLQTSADQSMLTLIPISLVDVDTSDEVSLTIDMLPKFGTLWISESNDAEGSQNDMTAAINYEDESGLTTVMYPVQKAGTVVEAGSELRFQAGQCEDFGILEVSFRVTVEDSAGASSSQDIEMIVDCAKLPLRWIVDLPGGSSVIFGVLCSVVGLLMCAVAIYFNVAYRKHMAVRVSSFRINIAMFMGCALIFAAILSMSLDTPSSECFVDGEPEGLLNYAQNVTSQFTGDCPNSNCFSRIWLLDCGAAITWGSLYAKTYRIKLLFMAKDFRTKAFTDKDIARGVSTYLFATVVMLAGFSAYIGWPELEFTTESAVMSSTANEKLIMVSATCSGGDAYTALTYVSLLAFALLQCFSAYIAFSVRNIDLKQVNDSKQMAVAIYTGLVIGLPGIFVGSLVQNSDLSFVITVFSICLATMAAVVSLAVPRMLDVYYKVEVTIGMTSSANNRNGAPTYKPSEVSFYKDNKLDSRMDTNFSQVENTNSVLDTPTSFI